jgi:uncharacterized glyoxalase superfamily protein PhnB
MMKALRQSQIFVLDQDEALDFYVGKLGLEIESDLDMGFMRWLTVRVPGDDRILMLEKPGPPMMDEATTEQVRELLTKGAMGGWIIFTVDDARKTHALLAERGVELPEEPEDRFYGTDFGLRDPFGNRLRIGSLKETPDAYPGAEAFDAP